MSQARDDDLDLIAAEYVLGTLEPDAARAFQQRLIDDAGARAALSTWEHLLAGLGVDLAPVRPPEAVWQEVAARCCLRVSDVSSEAASMRPAQSSASPARNPRSAQRLTQLRRWQSLAAAASIAAIALAGLLFAGGFNATLGTAPAYASVIYDQPTGMSWLITSREAGDALSIEAMDSYAMPDGKVLRLWVCSPGGKAHLIGRLPAHSGHYDMNMSQTAQQMLGDQSQFVVSMEDADRVATAGPSGPIMWT